MKAVILAAGTGGRLRGVVGDRPKCLARVGDCTLLERQIRTLRDCGVADITVVAGFKTAEVRRTCGPSVRIVNNTRYAATNSLYSLWLARNLLADGFVVLNCDVLFHPQMLVDLLTARYEDALLLGARADADPYSAEEMKVHVRRGVVVAIDKGLADADSDGENVGIAKFGRSGARVLIEQLNALVSTGVVRDWLPRAFAAFARIRPLHVVETRGYPWIEIDFPEDYWRACSEVLPAIEDSTSCTNVSTTFVNVRSR
jgi:choline kinase